MIDRTINAADPDADRIRVAAAAWLARMERRSSPARRRDLDRWLAADPRHAAAYQRIGQRFGDARMLRLSGRYADRPPPRRGPSRAAMAGVAGVLVALVLLIWTANDRLSRPGVAPTRTASSPPAAGAPAAAVRRLATAGGVGRSVGLADGSVVTLDAAAVVEVVYTPDARRLTLRRGRARFVVAHDGRPFTVFARGGAVTARGTVFDVALDSGGHVGVVLLRGSVDVTAAAGGSPGGARALRRLSAGQAVGYAGGSLGPVAAAGPDTAWADRAAEFDNVSLGYLLDRANRTAAVPIRVAVPDLAGLRVSGRFDTADSARLAQSLARLFDLRVERGSHAVILHRD